MYIYKTNIHDQKQKQKKVLDGEKSWNGMEIKKNTNIRKKGI